MKKSMLYIIIIFICVLAMTVGYAAISDEYLYITGVATASRMNGLFISGASVSSGSGTITAYEQTVLNSRVVLDANSSSSTVTMSVTIQNNSGEPKQFDKIVYDSSFYDNPNIIVATDSNLTHGQIINDNSSVTFNITFKYDPTYIANNTAPYANILNSVINFKFGIDPPTIHNVTYNHITSGTLPATVNDGEDLVAIFTGTVPNSIHVNGSTNYNYTSGTLVVYAVTNDLIISNIDSIQLPLTDGSSGVQTIAVPGFTNGVYFRNFIGMSWTGENLTSQTITKISFTAHYTDSSNRDRDANINLVIGGNTITQNLHVLGNTTNADVVVDFDNINLPANTPFSVNITGQSNTRNITIHSFSLTAYYS